MPPTVVLLTVAFVANLLVNTVIFPVFRAPDEPNHVDMVRHTARALAGHGDDVVHAPDAVRPISQAAADARALAGLRGAPGQMPPLDAAAASPRSQRPSFTELEAAAGEAIGGEATGGEGTGVRNQMTQHPPGYYVVAGAAVARIDATGAPFDLQVVLLRMLGVVMSAALPALAWWSAGRLGADAAGRTVAALVICAIPMLAHIAASVNNDVLLVALMAWLTPLLLQVAQRPRVSWGLAIGVGVLAGAALLTKGFALVTLPWLALAFTVGLRRGTLARRAVQLLVAVGVAMVVGGWWWLRNLLTVGTVQPSHASVGGAPPGFEPEWDWWAAFAVQRLLRRFWIEPDTVQQVPPWEALAALAIAGLVVLGAWRGLRRGQAASLAVVLLPIMLLLGLVGWGAAQAYVETGRPFGLNGRYLFAAAPGFAAVAGLASRPGRGLTAVLVMGTVTVAMQAWAWSAALQFYWGTGAPGAADELRALAAWSPLPPPVVAVAAVAAPAALLAALATEVTRQRRGLTN